MEELLQQVETQLKEVAELRADNLTLRTESAELKVLVAEWQWEQLPGPRLTGGLGGRV